MYVAHYDPTTGSWEGSLKPYGPLELYPSAQALNYGQAVFEGMKAQRSAKGRIVLFRPEQNAERMEVGDVGNLGVCLCCQGMYKSSLGRLCSA